MSRAAISVERVEFNPEENTITVNEKQNRISSYKKAHYEVFEFMAFLVGHIPSPYESITFYYGIYSGSYRGKESKEKRENPLFETEKREGRVKASTTLARLIHKIFVVDPWLCPNSGEAMKIIAFISDYNEIKKPSKIPNKSLPILSLHTYFQMLSS